MSDDGHTQESGERTLADLARQYLDLWQDHAALTASDPQIAEQWQQMFRTLADAATNPATPGSKR